MQRRDPLMVAFLSLITFGIYGLVWYVKTKNEMNAKGAEVPTAWLIIVPIVGWFWLWKFCQGVEMVTNKGLSGAMAFLLLIFLSPVGVYIIQDALNKVAA
jgi:hypothetical protein